MLVFPSLSVVRERLATRPPRRVSDSESEKPPRRAAVATVLRENDGRTEVLFIRRAEHEADPWSGHMAFPGGRHDPGDTDLAHTAVRETLEEVGLDLPRLADPLGALDDLPAIARGRPVGLVISPFVWGLRGPATLVLNHEVNEALWSPIDPLLRGERATTIDYLYEGHMLHLPGYDVDGRIVWGLTFQMLSAFFDRLREG